MKSSLRCITTLFAKPCNCSSGRKPYLLQPEWENMCRSWDRSFSSSSFPGRVYAAGLGTAAAALGGTVAVVSPALPSANESAAQGGREDFCGPPSLPQLPSPFQGKMESCFRLHHQQPQCLPRKRPRLGTWLLLQFRWG